MTHVSVLLDTSRYSTCRYCGAFGRITKDHIIPKSADYNLLRRLIPTVHKEAWLDYVTNNENNLIDCCTSCNQEKGSMSPMLWLTIMPEHGVAEVVKHLIWIKCSKNAIAAVINRRSELPEQVLYRRRPHNE